MASIRILYYNIKNLWDHRHICGSSLTETSLCDTHLYRSWLQQTSYILLKILHKSQYTSKWNAFNSGVTFFKRVFHLGWWSLQVTETSLLIYNGLHGNSQWTLCQKLHIFVLFHILSINLYYLLQWITYGLEMWAYFFTGNISSKTHTQNMNRIYLQDKKDVHNV